MVHAAAESWMRLALNWAVVLMATTSKLLPFCFPLLCLDILFFCTHHFSTMMEGKSDLSSDHIS